MPVTHPNDIALISLDEVGEVSQLQTTARTVVSAINELAQKTHLTNITNGTNNATKVIGTHTGLYQGTYSFALSYSGSAQGDYSASFGYGCDASGTYSFAVGYNTLANGQYSFAAGKDTQATGLYAHAEGYYCKATNQAAHAEGYLCEASGLYAHSENLSNTAAGPNSHAGGKSCVASGFASFAHGTSVQARYNQTTIGRYNTISNATDTDYNATAEAFTIGNGTGTTDRGNAFKVHFDGRVFADGPYSTPAADYAEFFEWADGNTDADDRTGLFVKLDGGKIVIAEEFDTPFGVISATPAVVGDSAELHWQGKYKTDDFGRVLYDTVIVPAEVDGDGNTVEPETVELRPAINPDFDAAQEYTPRAARPEWAAVGVLGKLVVYDDGTLRPGDLCRVGSGGKAARAIQSGCPVLKRVAEDKVLIWFRQGDLQ